MNPAARAYPPEQGLARRVRHTVRSIHRIGIQIKRPDLLVPHYDNYSKPPVLSKPDSPPGRRSRSTGGRWPGRNSRADWGRRRTARVPAPFRGTQCRRVAEWREAAVPHEATGYIDGAGWAFAASVADAGSVGSVHNIKSFEPEW